MWLLCRSATATWSQKKIGSLHHDRYGDRCISCIDAVHGAGRSSRWLSRGVDNTLYFFRSMTSWRIHSAHRPREHVERADVDYTVGQIAKSWHFGDECSRHVDKRRRNCAFQPALLTVSCSAPLVGTSSGKFSPITLTRCRLSCLIALAREPRRSALRLNRLGHPRPLSPGACSMALRPPSERSSAAEQRPTAICCGSLLR